MEEWKEYKATEFCQTVTDGTHDSPKPKDKGCYLITSKHLKDTGIDFNSANYISEEDYIKIIARSKVEQYDILFSMIGTIGNTVQVKAEYVDFAVKNMGIFKMGKNRLKSSWLLYWLKSPCAHEYVSQRLAGSTQSYLTLSSLRNFPVLYPGDSKANKIVAILKSLDDKIEVNRRINDNLEQQAQALFRSWFVDFEPFRDQPFVESELGMIPEGWRVGTLSDLANITMGTSPSGTSYNVSGEGEVFYQGRAEFGYRFPHRNLFTTEPKRYAEEGDVLLSVRAPVGDVNIANERCCIGRGLAAIGSNNYPSYILYLVKSLKSVFEQYNGEGTVFGSINKKTLEGLRIIVPEIRYIEKFEEIANPLDSQIRNKEEESRRLSELRDTLLPRLMSGELSVDGLKGQFAVSPGRCPGSKEHVSNKTAL